MSERLFNPNDPEAKSGQLFSTRKYIELKGPNQEVNQLIFKELGKTAEDIYVELLHGNHASINRYKEIRAGSGNLTEYVALEEAFRLVRKMSKDDPEIQELISNESLHS